MRKSLFAIAALLLTIVGCKGSLEDIPSSVAVGVVTIATCRCAERHSQHESHGVFRECENVSIPNSSVSADTCAQLPFPGINYANPTPAARRGNAGDLRDSERYGAAHTRKPRCERLRLLPHSGERQHCREAGADLARHDSRSDERLSRVRLRIHERGFARPRADQRDSRQHRRSLAHLESAGRQDRIGRSGARVGDHGWTPDTQIFCQFTDNGSHAVEKRLANLWRAGTAKHVHAYRFLTSITNDGTDQLDVVSQYSTDSTHIINP